MQGGAAGGRGPPAAPPHPAQPEHPGRHHRRGEALAGSGVPPRLQANLTTLTRRICAHAQASTARRAAE
ncbi:hypothetical protein D2T81_25430 [Azospirillum brasilense]|nr:hypothetical protein D2T81_25430 [Azospirillum brasilense]